ncbi:Digeranylgeranylglycerophospholipid reductase [uncultured archaeon]|nr:Digeranylgeranylglycerophospholipid reductase [uncultured archaeon]
MTTWDVLIIGAGPAGCSAAWTASSAGLKTLVVEEHPNVGEPVHCGECLSETALNRLPKKPPSSVFSRSVKGIRAIFPAGIARNVTEPGYVLEKHLFEGWLAKEAQDVGAEVRTNSRLTRISRNSGIWQAEIGNSKEEARIVIDASGVQSVVSRLISLNERSKTVVGIQYEMKGIEVGEYLDFYLWPHLAPHGYLWVIPKSGGRANVGLVTDDNTNAKKYLDNFIAEIGLEGKGIVKTFGGLIPAGGPVSRTFSDGVMVVGDAAGFTSPLFEGGTALGMKSGEIAAKVAFDALSANDTSKARLSFYEAGWRKEFPPYEKILAGKNMLYSLQESELSRLAGLLPVEMGSLSAWDKVTTGLRILFSSPKNFPKALPAFKALGYSRAHSYGW